MRSDESASSKTVYVLLPVHNRKAITLEFVRGLKRQTYPAIQLVLIDDGSTDGTADAVIELLPQTKVIRGDGNLWWAGALQAGIDLLKSDRVDPESIVLMINDDTIIAENFVEVGESLISTSRKKIVCARSYSLQTGELTDAGVRMDWFHYRTVPAKTEAEINCLSTRGLFLRFSDVIAIGEFKPHFLPHYFSDYEFTIRAGKRGYQLSCPPELKLTMNETTTGTHSADGLGLRAYLKKVFQIRAVINPWTSVKFITAAAPMKYKLICYMQLLIYFSKRVVISLRNGF